MQARIAYQDAIPRIYSGHANTAARIAKPRTAKPQSTLTDLHYNLVVLSTASATSPTQSFNPRSKMSSPGLAVKPTLFFVLLHPLHAFNPAQTLDHLAPHHAWARKWVPNAHAMQIASQAPKRYAGDPRRRWGLMGGPGESVRAAWALHQTGPWT